MANQQLNDKCLKLELDKQNAEKLARIIYKQLEKLTLVLNKPKKEAWVIHTVRITIFASKALFCTIGINATKKLRPVT